MSSEELAVSIPPATVPESVLKKRKRDDQWSLTRKQKAEETKSNSAANRKGVFKRAEQFIKEYRQQVCFHDVDIPFCLQRGMK
mgnify:FL=1